MTVGDINSLWLENYDVGKGSVKWSSSRPSIVSVDRSGSITAKKLGAVVISCSDRNGNEIANVTINVYDNPSDIPAKAKIGYASKKMTAGDLNSLWLEDSNVDESTIRWISTNPAVVSVDQNGVVTAKKSGTAIISCFDISNNQLDGIKITVSKAPYKSSFVAKATIGYATTEMTVNDINSVWLESSNVDEKNIKWSSSQPSVVYVDRSGAVTAKKTGTATISCTDKHGKILDSVTINVYDNPSDIPVVVEARIGYASKKMTVGDIYSLWLEDYNVDENTIKWSSTNTAIASVDQYGVVTANKSGTVNISCNDEYGNVLDNVTIKVVN